MKARVAIVGAVVLASCAHAALDRGRSRGDPKQGVPVSEVPVRGASVQVYGRIRSETNVRIAEGELIAVEDSTIYLLLPETRVVSRVPFRDVERVVVRVDSSGAGAGAAAWTAAGCASTLTHGVFLVFTGPLWLSTGISTVVAENNASVAEASPRDLQMLHEYARFPQGRPESWGGERRPAASAAPVVPLAPAPAPSAFMDRGSVVAPPIGSADGGGP